MSLSGTNTESYRTQLECKCVMESLYSVIGVRVLVPAVYSSAYTGVYSREKENDPNFCQELNSVWCIGHGMISDPDHVGHTMSRASSRVLLLGDNQPPRNKFRWSK